MIVIDGTPTQTAHRFRGPGYYTAHLLRALANDVATGDIGIAACKAAPNDLPIIEEIRRGGQMAVFPMHLPRHPAYRLSFQLGHLAAHRLLRSVHPRVYHATVPTGIAVQRGTATVATLYDLIPFHSMDEYYPWRRLDQRQGYRRSVRLLGSIDHIVAISEDAKRDAIENLHIAPERITVTPLAADGSLFYPRSAVEVDAVRTRYGMMRPYFLHVGGSHPQKNTRRLLRAFQDVACDHQLCFAGAWSRSSIREARLNYPELCSTGRISFLGFVEDAAMAALYSGAEALIYPSLHEGFGLPVLEAMSCGSVVITSDVSSLPEVGGDAALLVDPFNVEAMTDALQRTVDDAHMRMARAEEGLQHASTFSWERTAQLMRDVYNALV